MTIRSTTPKSLLHSDETAENGLKEKQTVEAIIAEICKPGNAVVFNGSVERGVKSGWAYTV